MATVGFATIVEEALIKLVRQKLNAVDLWPTVNVFTQNVKGFAIINSANSQ